ncbi:hypothetical protein [Aliivibrio fischeri]|uniref:hypothetical protein n=1 Tax=Aliivibrio fischeri TaxID=668 RepID=UPI00080E980F|nr:hypothetical protein [Aliivibrio fischeri]OCH04846.1 hypothetical protein A6E09_18300 [Aliivibrio fischeri]
MGKDSLLNNYSADHPFVTGDIDFLGDWEESEDYHEFDDDDDDDEEEEDSRSYDGWLKIGRQVLRGEKSHRINGQSLFYLSQTKKIKESRIAKCNGCGKTLRSENHKDCKDCGWMICRNCYSCGCED